jgi:hypothetical protein
VSTITERRFSGARRNRFAITSVGVVFVGAVSLAFFVIPMRTWTEQRSSIASKSEQFAAFEDINDALQDEVDVLKTPEGIQEAIRSQLGYLLASEKRVPMLDVPNAAANLPTEWPYSVVTNILQVRIAQAVRNSGVEILNPLQP